MNLDTARENIGAAVVYDDGHGTRQDGTIVRVGERGVYVRYGHNDISIALTPETNLRLLATLLAPVCTCAANNGIGWMDCRVHPQQCRGGA